MKVHPSEVLKVRLGEEMEERRVEVRKVKSDPVGQEGKITRTGR